MAHSAAARGLLPGSRLLFRQQQRTALPPQLHCTLGQLHQRLHSSSCPASAAPLLLRRALSNPSARRSQLHCRAMAAPAVATADSKISRTQLLEVAEAAAQAGAEVIRQALDKPRNISYKGVTDLVTDTDQASEDAIMAVLKQAFPDHAFLGEEGGVSGNTSSEYLWCCDPLDGTTNFAHSYPCFAVSIAVLQHATPVAACVVEFAGGPQAWVTRTFTATRNGGAFCNGQRIGVSRIDNVTRSLLVTGFGYEHDEAWAANLELFRHFTDVSRGVRRLGAAAVDLCHVALGIVEGYWEYRLKPWDMAAGVLMVEEAGGRVTTMDGRAFSVFDRSVLATNDALHEAVLEQTRAKTNALLEQGIDMSPWFVPDGYRVHAGAQL